MPTAIIVKHNIEMAHRLWDLPGKCTQLHGHSWHCELRIEGPVDKAGILMELGGVKKQFRSHLDSHFDHHLALDYNDPLIVNLTDEQREALYPGVVRVPGMPTVENMARWIHDWAAIAFGMNFTYQVRLWEASTNGVDYCAG